MPATSGIFWQKGSFRRKSRYDGYIQLENGVGMIRLLYEEFMDALGEKEDDGKTEELSMATGFLPYPYLKRLLEPDGGGIPGKKDPSLSDPQ